jgi:hypothetical protein
MEENGRRESEGDEDKRERDTHTEMREQKRCA